MFFPQDVGMKNYETSYTLEKTFVLSTELFCFDL